MHFRLSSGTQLRQYFSLVAIVAGVALLVYVGSQYWVMYSEQQRLAREWQEQQQGPAASQLKPAGIDDGLTRLSIPKISLNAVVVEGSNHRALLLGPGHIKDTPAPGDAGNSVITGHRDTFFRHIYELTKGDVVTVQRKGKSFDYEVVGKKVVQPTDISVLDPSSDSRLTLITCYPTYYIGPAPERLVVFTKLSEHNQARVEPASAPMPKSSATAVH